MLQSKRANFLLSYILAHNSFCYSSGHVLATNIYMSLPVGGVITLFFLLGGVRRFCSCREQKVLGIVFGNGCELRALTLWACRHCIEVTISCIRVLISKVLRRKLQKYSKIKAILGAKVLGIEKWVNH